MPLSPPRPVLETARLLMRDYQPGDWRAVHRYAADPVTVRFLLWGPNSEDETRAFIARVLANSRRTPRQSFELAILAREERDVVGGVALRIEDRIHRHGSMGYVLRPDVWGRGYGTEAARAVIAFGFGELGLHRIWAHTVPENEASQRVLEKAGMRCEGRLRETYTIRGVWHDAFLFAILREEWGGS